MSDCIPVTTPMDANAQLSKEQSPKTQANINAMKAYPYSQLVGSLISNPGQAHWQAAKHLLRYLKGTVDFKLLYAPDPSQSELFTAYCDADHTGNWDNRCSTSGMVIKMGTGV
ncbi:hypothetical protein M0805_006260, partial [Coniferiporia weirii]